MLEKSRTAFESGNGPCYEAELSGKQYTRQDFIDLCYGDIDLASRLFGLVEWQHPETCLDEWEMEGEIEAQFSPTGQRIGWKVIEQEETE